LKEETIEMAFEKSIGVVAGSDENDCKVCCCMHAHKDDCLWLRYRDKFGEDKAHELHTAGLALVSSESAFSNSIPFYGIYLGWTDGLGQAEIRMSLFIDLLCSACTD
jgi:hypothetical protein